MTQAGLFDEPVEFIDRRPVLLDCQRDVIARLRDAFRGGKRRIICQAPCGGGKTLVAAEQTRLALAMGKTVLHIVHRRRLVDQMIGMLDRFGIRAAPIMEGRPRERSPVSCASRDTLLAMLKNDSPLPPTDLLILDECHVQSAGVLGWYLQNYPQTYWLGFTATPIAANGASLAPPYQGLVCMATTSELLTLGRLCPVKVYDPDAVGRRRRKGDKVKPVGCPIAHWVKYALGQPTVVFAGTIADSQAIVQKYRMAGITAEHMDAFTPEDEREAIFERSRLGATKIISNVGVLVEGVDLPWLVCCQILRGCNSLILFVQAAGRIMRSFKDKKNGILLDHAGASHEYLRGEPGKEWDFQWTLDDEATNARNNKPPKNARAVTCVGCGAVFVGKPACPECGRVLPKNRRKSLLEQVQGDSVLTEFNAAQNEHHRNEVMERLWKKCLYIVRAKGGNLKQAAAMFARNAKCPPWEAGLDALPQRGEWGCSVKDWLDAQMVV